jgi:hypothetical protein
MAVTFSHSSTWLERAVTGPRARPDFGYRISRAANRIL